MYVIITSDVDGNPICPVCYAQVGREGEFCSASCWQDFHVTLFELEVAIIDISYLPLEQQPWYGKDHD